jgi:solute carrier family 25 (peroxisomal adenine nucleotide transporter), member 17
MSESKKRVQPSDMPLWANAFSGAVGGSVAMLSVYPLELISTRLQVQNKIESDDHYDGVVDAVVKIFKKHGISGFYDGAGSETLATFIQAFFYFFAYEKLRTARMKSIARSKGRAPSTLGVGEELLIGTMAGVFCKFFTSPINNITTRQQTADIEGNHSGRHGIKALKGAAKLKREIASSTAPSEPPSGTQTPQGEAPSTEFFTVAKQIYKEKGLTGFWAGYKATIILSINPSLTYYFFQLLRTNLIPRRRRENPTSLEIFFLAAFAKIFAIGFTYPIILAKTRIQIKRTADKLSSVHMQIYSTLKAEGFSGLYTGVRAQILKGFFSQGITMMTKDQIARAIIYLYFVTRKALRPSA